MPARTRDRTGGPIPEVDGFPAELNRGEGEPASPRGAPTAGEVRISIRILLHIARQGRYGPGEIPPDSLTQTGIARALKASQGAVSNALRRLTDGGVVRSGKNHVPHRMVRVTVYQLTDRGEDLVARLRASSAPAATAATPYATSGNPPSAAWSAGWPSTPE